jgi:hypothetical protein
MIGAPRPWEEILKNPLLWHFRFGGPDMERLVAGRERIYLDRFWNEFSANPDRFSAASREHYAALYARPGAMHAGFVQFAAFDQDAIDNKAFLADRKLTMPVLALGGEKSFGLTMAEMMKFAATDVQGEVVPDSGHWIMKENPAATIKLVLFSWMARRRNSLAPDQEVQRVVGWVVDPALFSVPLGSVLLAEIPKGRPCADCEQPGRRDEPIAPVCERVAIALDPDLGRGD